MKKRGAFHTFYLRFGIFSPDFLNGHLRSMYFIHRKALTKGKAWYRWIWIRQPGLLFKTHFCQIRKTSVSLLHAQISKAFAYDLYYIANQSLWLDLRLLVATGMKAAGVGPTWLRRLFFLPCRNTVAGVFRQTADFSPDPEPQSSAHFQTV